MQCSFIRPDSCQHTARRIGIRGRLRLDTPSSTATCSVHIVSNEHLHGRRWGIPKAAFRYQSLDHHHKSSETSHNRALAVTSTDVCIYNRVYLH
jgi:hypothetical protein